MNDFTKEELFDLRYAIDRLKQPAKNALGFYYLRDKITSLIDNYCEQEDDELEEIVKLLQSQVNDLRWRMNEVCNFLSLKFPEANTPPLSLYMREEFDE